MMLCMDISERITQVLSRMEGACTRAGRAPASARLIMVSKTVPAERLRPALASGQLRLGENKVQELRDKQPLLADLSPEWHFIGHLQTNKAKDLIGRVALIHSVDRLELAHKLQQRLEAADLHQDILIQVNTSAEDSKSGVAPEQAEALVQVVATCSRLHIRGLMTIGTLGGDEAETRRCFRLLRHLRDQIAAQALPGVQMHELSMGMSSDFEWAIEEGATLVRVGSTLFGARN
jgi:pyridoxal phosphate enzyme (YggS family)